MKHRIAHIVFALCLITGLSACDSGVKRALGFKKHSPDEFMVISRPPLTVPPDFSLEAPSDEQIRPRSQVRQEAKQVLFSGDASKKPASPASRGEADLLKQAGAENANPDIRNVLNREASDARVEEEDKGLLQSIIDPLKPAKKDPLVDIDKEEERLEKNKAEGKAPNEGEVPEKASKSKGIINDLLGQ